MKFFDVPRESEFMLRVKRLDPEAYEKLKRLKKKKLIDC